MQALMHHLSSYYVLQLSSNSYTLYSQRSISFSTRFYSYSSSQLAYHLSSIINIQSRLTQVILVPAYTNSDDRPSTQRCVIDISHP